jgi:ssDNA-specific exonuclease RecJ
MISEFNDQYLNTTYDKFSQEQSQVMTALKNEEEEAKLFEKLYQQQVHILHRILMDLIKLRNLKSKIEEKKNNM